MLIFSFRSQTAEENESVIDSWGIHSDENINSGIILSFNAVCAGSPVIIMLQKGKQTSIRKIRNFKFD